MCPNFVGSLNNFGERYKEIYGSVLSVFQLLIEFECPLGHSKLEGTLSTMCRTFKKRKFVYTFIL